ncbi:CARDB domain-containing protein [Hymenobacter negativus]|uniref:Fibronectin type III domain-containing protein n=1 Tax=Hymenobacter negativus TaxID=2795026 RepID=A0ABS3QNP1_9BACT|nr:CARDB domain-containing protein [Hymenobacter negativus]MBO2012727.1 fibronectin type III domain-containing protein [Hymenobacter negativus]
MELLTYARLRPWLIALLLLSALLTGRLARAQAPLNYAEYFVDTDPGVGLGTRVTFPTAAAVQDHTFSPNLTGVAAGVHTLYMRVHSQSGATGRWSHTFTRTFLRLSPAASGGVLPNVVRAEYFIDADPGVGQGTALAVTPGTSVDQTYMLNLASVPAGVHSINVRVQDQSRRWSHTFVRSFLKLGATTTGGPAPNLTAAEYFIDSDPGVGRGTALAVTPGASIDQTYPLDFSAVSTGVHSINLRVRDANGRWSHTFMRSFLKLAPAPAGGNVLPNLTRAEYFIDADPGVGQGTALAVTPGSSIDQTYMLDLSGVTAGIHNLTTRVRDANGRWSHNFTRPFLKLAPTAAPGVRPLITKIRYLVTQGTTVVQGPDEYVLPAASRAADIDQTFTPQLCLTAAGTYVMNVTAVDAQGRAAIEYSRSFTVNTPTKFQPMLMPTVAACTGQTVTLSSAAAGTGATYLWSTGATTQSITVTTPGKYYINVTSGSGCVGSDTSRVTFNPAPVVALADTTAVTCGGNSTTLNAGAGFASYLWNTGATTQTIVVNTPGRYRVTVGTGAGGCSATDSTEVLMPNATIQQTSQTICAGQSRTLSLATPINGTVRWSTGATTASITASPTATTTYTATVRVGSYSCSASVTLTVVPSTLTVTGPAATQCAGQSSTLATPATAGYTYTWSPATYLSATTGASVTATPLQTTTYTVTSTNGTCTSSGQVTVTVTPAPQALANPTSVAAGQVTTLNVANPQPGTTYAWSGPGLQSTTGTTVSALPTVVGSAQYTVVATLTATGCTSSGQTTVTVTTTPCAAPTNLLVGNITQTAAQVTFTAASGATGYTLSYTPQGGSTQNQTVAGSPVNLAGLTPGVTYNVSLTTNCGGQSSAAQTTSFATLAPPVVALGAFSPVCISVGSFALTGGSPAGGTYSGPGVSGGQFNPATAGAGSHTITYTYTLNGWTGTATQPLQVFALPTVTQAAFPLVCQGAAAFALTGGSPAGGTYAGTGVSGGQFSAATAGVGTFGLSYSYTDGNGCASTAFRSITVLPTPTLAATDTLVCAGQPVTLTVSNTGAGATYAWSTGATTASIVVNPLVRTAYTVTVTNAAGCAYTRRQVISTNPYNTAPGLVGQLQPVDNSNGLSLPITFSWSPASAATTYDLYVWPATGSQSATATVANINALQYTYNGALPYGAQYRWRVVARNPCFSTPGPVLAFGLRDLPDLRVSFIQNPDTVYAGQTMQMSWNVTNTGAGSTLAQQWQDQVWLSQDSVFNSSTAVQVGTWGNTSFLQPNATYITNATFRVPYSQAGYYYVFVRANTGALLETNYTNNRFRSPKRTLMIVPTTPDFSLENFVSPPNPSVGYTDVTMRYRVYNRGSVAATQVRYDEFFISPDTIQNISQNTGRGALGPNAISLGRQRVTDTLLTNGFYARTVSVRIPHTEYGTRYFYVYSDTDNSIFETASTNNVNRPVPVDVILRPPADLLPIQLTAPANLIAGTSANIVWDVRNSGLNAPVAEERYWADKFWLSPTATFNPATAIAVGTTNIFGGDTLAVDHHYRRSVALAIPNGLSGAYYVFGQADYVQGSTRGNVFEYTHENNNLLRSGLVNISLAYADLQPTAFTGPATLDAFQTFTVNYTVRNSSTAVGPANGTWSDAVWLVSPGGSANGCQLLGRVSHTGPLAPGASYSGSMLLSIPRYVTPGNYEVLLKTDDGNAVYEYNFENNNEQRFALTYNYSDDLRLTALSTTGTAYSGQTIGLSFGVDNQGAFRTLATGWREEFYLSTDATLDAADLRLTTVTHDGDLAVGSSYNGTATVRLPHGLQGSYFVIGKAGVPDGRGYCSGTASSVLNDMDPANNVRTMALPILLTPPADLIPTASTLPTDVVAGQQVTIPFTIQNQGVGATLEGNWDDGIYLNTSPSVNGSVRIGTYRHPGTLGAGQSYAATITATIPAYMSGNYYVFLVTDISGSNGYSPSQLWGGAVQYGTVYEHQQELNNIVQGSILIRVPQPADLIVTSVTVPATRQLGETMTVHYQVKNQGVNPAVGQLKDGLYLSQDATVDGAVDQLFASQTRNITIAPNQTVSGVVRSRLQGLLPGTYHGLMATNLFNDIYEGAVSSPAANNNVTDAANQLALGVNILPLRIPTSFPLMKDSVVYYRVTPGANKDMVLTLTSNKSLGQNEMYVAYNRVPTAADYDFIYLNQVSTAQEILVPTTGPLPYYVLVKTPYQYPSLQTATLYADTLGFQVRSITANRVGRGRVTTQVLGAGFHRLRTGANGYPATRFYLTQGNSPAIRAEAQVLTFRNSTEVTLRWRLDTLSLGQYHVVADNNGTRVQLTNGLTVEAARPLNVDFATIIPQTVRVGTNANWTYFLQNNSNVDVPYWEFQYELPPGQSPVITHTPNVRKKSDFHTGAASATPRNRLDDGLTEVLPFVATDLRPGEIIQVNLRLTPTRLGGLPVVWNQAALTEEWYTRQTLDHIGRYRAAVLASPASYPAGVASLAANAPAWQDSLRRYYVHAGLLDTAALRAGRLRTGYTATSASIAIPGGVCGTWGVTECVRPFRPNPFDANSYPAALVNCADSIVFTYKGRGASCTQVVGSIDPNLIAGPAGSGRRKMVGAQQRLSYQVQFENDPVQATAPAQVVRVTVPLSTAFDAQQFRLGSYGWADYTFPVPANASSYSTLLDMPDSLGYDVRVLGTVDVVGRRLLWQFETIDPATGVAPLDPNKGFLALNDSTGRGQGFVNYTIKASPAALTGDTLAAQATIVFDTNPPLATNRWKNVLDAVAPTSQLAALPPTTSTSSVVLNWTAQDDTGGSGLLSYDLYASKDGGAFAAVAQNLPTTSYSFAGEPGARYDFFVLAQDTTSNREALKTVGNTYTVLSDTTLVVYNLLKNQCLTSQTVVSSGLGTWQRLLLNGQTVAAINDQGHALGNVKVEFSVMSGTIRQDARGTKYLDRNWHFIADSSFTGKSVLVRFYGLPAEFDKLKAADLANVTAYNSLRLTQYSGPNEDCSLANNATAVSTVRLLTPQTTTRLDQDCFVAQATITDHFSEFYLHGGNRPLPVELMSFAAVRRGADVLATWTTATEKNSAYFALEATDSPRGDGFRELGRVAAAGNSTAPRSYSFSDRNVPTTGGVRYYRLRQTDTNGAISYSPVQAVQLAKEEATLSLSAVPNPFFHAELQATISAPEAVDAVLQLLDMTGRSLLTHKLHLTAGRNAIELPELASLPAGVYVLRVRVGTEVRQVKLLKQ